MRVGYSFPRHKEQSLFNARVLGTKALALVALVICSSLLPILVQSALAQENGNGSSTEINVRNADLGAIIKIFSKKTKRNYILDEKVTGKVTIYLPGKVSDSESIRILEAILSLKGYTSVPIGENLWKIVAKKDAKQSTIPTFTGEDSGPGTAAVVTHLLRLKHVGAEDMQQLLSQLISSDGLINAYARTNSLIIIDSEDNIKRLVEIVEAVDIPSSDQDMTIIPVEYADATQLADTLKEILSEEEGASGGGHSQRAIDLIRSRLRDSRSSTSSASKKKSSASKRASSSDASNITVSARGSAAKIIPDERTNSIVVVADETTTARLRALISQLDSEVDLSGNRFYVYRCQHASAEELADVLAGLTGQSSSGSNSSGLVNSSTGLSRVNQSARSQRGRTSERTQSRLADARRTPGRSRRENDTNRSAATNISFGEDISITADPSTNSLIIAANKTDYLKIKELLKKLDIRRRQVLVEAMILEVGITDNASMGTEFIASGGGDDGGVLASSNFGSITQLLADPTQLSDFSVAAASSGTLTLPGDIVIPTQTVLLNAAETNTNVNVLSAPNILATDNEEAEIVVGQNVPFVASTSTSSDNLNNTFNQVDRQDVGITLRLTPQISSGEYVRLQLFTEVSSVIAATANSDLGPTTTLRTSETTVITKDGQMVVIGGLMSDDITESERGVPFLKDIPLFGGVFKVTSEDRRRTNLLIFITPRIIKDQYDARDTTTAKRDQIEGEIFQNDLYPRRQEVLRNSDIDRVAESSEYKGPKPSTILPPKQPIRPESTDTAIQLKELSAIQDNKTNFKTSKQAVESNANVIELKASPKLPIKVESNSKKVELSAAKPIAASVQANKVSADMFLVFKPVDSKKFKGVVSKSLNMLPFEVAENGEFGVILPKDSNQLAKQFFKIGTNYSYRIKDSKLAFTMVGTFKSGSEASQLYPQLSSNWHTLSPYEIMNLGRGPWSYHKGAYLKESHPTDARS